MSESATETVSDSLESDEDFDLGHKISELKEQSQHPKFENVGYIRWVEDHIDNKNEIVVQVDYPNNNLDFKEAIEFPKDFEVDSKLKSLIEHPDLPFSEGSFTNDELQDEAVPIDPEDEEIKIDATRNTSLHQSFLSKVSTVIAEKDLLVSFIFLLSIFVTIIGLFSIIIAFFLVIT